MANENFKTVFGDVSKELDIEGSGDPCLVVIAGSEIGKIYYLDEGEMVLGRDESCDIVCDSPMASRRHAVIMVKGDAITIKDMGSTNGTFVNSRKMSAMELRDGDKIGIGETILKYLARNTVESNFHDELYKLASLDGLTLIYNKRHFDEFFQKEFSKAQRSGTQLGLCMLDIDFFKKVNDTFGHQAGDGVLCQLADLVRSMIRQEDIFARYGGEEFCLLCPGQGCEQTVRVAERIRRAVEENVFLHFDQRIPLTVSIGVCCFRPDLESHEAMIQLADERLYASKKGGRNRVTV